MCLSLSLIPGSLNDSGDQVHFPQERVFLFGVFDEKESWFPPAGDSAVDHVIHTINGYAAGALPGQSTPALAHFVNDSIGKHIWPFSHLSTGFIRFFRPPDVSICAHCTVSLHLVGMSSEPEVFSVHMNGQVLQHRGHKVSTVGLVSGAATTCSVRAIHVGRWLLSSQTNKHMEGKPPRPRSFRSHSGHSRHGKELSSSRRVQH